MIGTDSTNFNSFLEDVVSETIADPIRFLGEVNETQIGSMNDSSKPKQGSAGQVSDLGIHWRAAKEP